MKVKSGWRVERVLGVYLVRVVWRLLVSAYASKEREREAGHRSFLVFELFLFLRSLSLVRALSKRRRPPFLLGQSRGPCFPAKLLT